MKNHTKKNSGISQSVQDYLKTIYRLENVYNKLVSTSNIAKELSISDASVTGMLKKLEAMGLVEYSSYKGVKLTQEGQKAAFDIIRRHRLIELFLQKHLGYSLANLHEEACELEHYVSDEFVDRIDILLGNPEIDPFGHSIPTKTGTIKDESQRTLAMAEVGEVVRIARLSDNEPKLLAVFEEKGLVRDAEIKIISKADFSPMYILLNGTELVVDLLISDKIYIDG